MKLTIVRESQEQAEYVSGAQNARVVSELWVRNEMYCPNCGNQKITQFMANRPVADFYCAACAEEYEIKSQKAKFGSKVLDGAFRTMCQRLDSSNNPSLILINYSLELLSVA